MGQSQIVHGDHFDANRLLDDTAGVVKTDAISDIGLKLVARIEAARLLTEAGFPISPATLAKKAVTGGGPPYRVWNRRAMYDVNRLMNWAKEQLGPEILNTAQR